MSKARLVITAIEVEGRSPAEVVAAYGVSRSWLYELLARYRAEGDAAFEPRSRRPHRSPAATPAPTVELVLRIGKQLSAAGLDAGAETIGWHLTHHHQTTLSRATIHRILTRAGQVTPEPDAAVLSRASDGSRQGGEPTGVPRWAAAADGWSGRRSGHMPPPAAPLRPQPRRKADAFPAAARGHRPVLGQLRLCGGRRSCEGWAEGVQVRGTSEKARPRRHLAGDLPDVTSRSVRAGRRNASRLLDLRHGPVNEGRAAALWAAARSSRCYSRCRIGAIRPMSGHGTAQIA
jgi:transposase